jgi:protein TonB
MKNSHLIHTTEFNDGYFWLRLALTLVIGVVVAGALTLFMNVLIEASQQALTDTPRASLLDFVRIKRDEVSQRKSTKPQRPSTDQAPLAPVSPQTSQSNLGETSIAISTPTVDTNVTVDIGIAIGTGDGEYLPIVKVAPAYPIKATMEGVEGDCTVEFTVTSAGKTSDINIVPGLCPPVFTRASINAAKKFKYKPRVVNGEAIEVPNVRNRFQFRLADQGVK